MEHTLITVLIAERAVRIVSTSCRGEENSSTYTTRMALPPVEKRYPSRSTLVAGGAGSGGVATGGEGKAEEEEGG